MSEGERTAAAAPPASVEDDAPGAQLALFGVPGLVAMAAAIALGAWYGFGGIVLLASLVAGTGLVARGWAAVSLRGLTYERELSRTRGFPGDSVQLRATIDNRKPLPLSWLEVEESLPPALAPDDPLVGAPDAQGRRAFKFSTPLGWYRTATLTRELVCRKRGYYQIGPARLSSADVFGLFVKSQVAAPADSLLVYPRLYSMTDLGLPARQPLGAARDPRRLFDDPSRPMGLRPYTPETPFKAVAWKASARSGELQAKLYEPTVTLKTALLLAVDSFADDDEAFEMAVSAVASIADHDLGQRRPVGVFANGAQADGSGPVMLPPGRAPDQRTLILEHLARLQRLSTGDFTSFVDTSLTASSNGATLAVVGKTFSDTTMQLLQEHQRRGRPVVLLIAGDAPMPRSPLPCQRIDMLMQRAAA